jgi:enoyl-CoA hydratase/carnithine racemase
MRAVENVEVTIEAGVATLRVVRPARRNALTNAMYHGLAALMHDCDADSAVRCIVLEGSDGVFTAGSDITAFLDKSPIEREAHFGLVAELFSAPAAVSKPVIAAVAGHALGGGTGLVAACDLAIAEEGSDFGLPEVDIGLWPCTLLPAVVRAIGARRAYELALLSRRIDAEEALRLGLIQRVVAKGTLDAEVAAMAARIAALSPLVVQMGKRAFQQSLDMEFSKATWFMGRVMALNSASADAREGISSFLEKRSPNWVGA